MAVRSKRVLITGITGFTGRYLHSALLSRGYEVQGLSRNDKHFLTVDFENLDALTQALKTYKPTHIIHLAGVAFPSYGVPSDIYHSNISGTVRLLDAACHVGDTLEQLIIVSSAAVYGHPDADGSPITENTPLDPISHYGMSKFCMENISLLYRKLPILCVRPFNYIGRGQNEKFFVPKIINAFLRNDEEIRVGNLQLVRDFSDVRDVIDVYVRLIEAGTINRTFNICSGIGTRLSDIIEFIASETARYPSIVPDAEFFRENEPEIMTGSDNLLTQEIGPHNRTPIWDTLRWILESESQSLEGLVHRHRR